jgi:Mrp family chromosome partitioning ATPase
VTYAETPHHPFKDKRGQIAAACGVGVGALAFVAMLLLGAVDPRLRRIADAESRLPKIGRLLGVLPALPDDSTSSERSAIAAYCVHHIRTMLQIQQRITGRRVLAVTSPSPGDGKTSLTVALGMSYAATGAKTLLIDCDLQGGGLTARMNSSSACRLGQILLCQHRISQDQLHDALEQARQQRKRLGDVLAEQNIVGDETIAQALAVQARMKAGLHGVVRGEPFEQCVLGTTVPNLHVLSLGPSEQRQSIQLSPTTLRPIFDQAARQYDTVLVDTGPILGCVEAALVAAEADGVVLVVARGGQKTLARGAMNYLTATSAEVEGIVFNRAGAGDLAHSWYSASRSDGSARLGVGPGSPANGRNDTRRLGPIPGAVLGDAGDSNTTGG